MITPHTPPRLTERVIEALGAERDLRDAMLGDLAEELAIRAAYDGEPAARRWYRREALRVAPYLVRDWARRLDGRGAGWLVLRVGAVLGLLAVGGWGTLAGVEVTVEGIAGPTTFPWHDPQPRALTLGVMLLGYLAVAAAGGWMASAREKRAPAVAALALGVALAVVAFVLPMPGRAPLPGWYLFGQTVAVLAGTALGGMWRIAARRVPQAGT